MIRSAAENHGGDTLRLTGAVTMATVPALEPMLRGATPIRRVDFSGVTEFDSSAVAVLLACVRDAGGAGDASATVKVDGAPATLRNLAKLYGVDGILGLA